jgi:hypothetical protein
MILREISTGETNMIDYCTIFIVEPVDIFIFFFRFIFLQIHRHTMHSSSNGNNQFILGIYIRIHFEPFFSSFCDVQSSGVAGFLSRDIFSFLVEEKIDLEVG